MDLAICVASGTSWLGHDEFKVSQNEGPVIIVDEESTSSSALYRLSCLLRGRGRNIQDREWRERLIVFVQQGLELTGERSIHVHITGHVPPAEIG